VLSSERIAGFSDCNMIVHESIQWRNGLYHSEKSTMKSEPNRQRSRESGAESLVPTWFETALSQPAEEFSTLVDGVEIICRAWGDKDSGTHVVLVHGGAASGHWWDHVAPFLAPRARVTAIDLSGNGDSGWRERYSLDAWAREVVWPISRASHKRRIIIGHSLGGFVCLRAAALFPSLIDRVLVIDSPVQDATPESEAALRSRVREHRHYATRSDAERHFAPRPAQAGSLSFILDHLAASSVAETPQGWTWKFDPNIFDRPGLSPTGLVPIGMPVTIFRAGEGKLSKEMAERMQRILGPAARVIELPGAGHHVMLDKPLLLISALRAAIN
jgi:pimeloyl-ACP methyl ester carboxylesterase